MISPTLQELGKLVGPDSMFESPEILKPGTVKLLAEAGANIAKVRSGFARQSRPDAGDGRGEVRKSRNLGLRGKGLVWVWRLALLEREDLGFLDHT